MKRAATLMTDTSDVPVGIVVVPAPWDNQATVAGLRPLLRHALALQAAGVARVVFLSGDEALELPSDARLKTPVERQATLGEADAEAACVVLRAEDTYHRTLPKALLEQAERESRPAAAVGHEDRRIIAAPRGAAAIVPLVQPGAELPKDAASRRVPAEQEPKSFVVAAATRRERRASAPLHLASLIKSTGGVFERLYMRPVSLRMTRFFMHTPVTPNMISVLTLGIALVSAVMVASTSRTVVIVGGALHIFMRIVDCIDGELARLRYQGSVFGAWLDTIGDGIGVAAFLIGLTWQVVHVQGEAELLWVGAVCVLCWLVIQAAQISAAIATQSAGTFQTIDWGHRQASGERSFAERFVAAVEYLGRIDALSTFLGVAVIVGAYAELLLGFTALIVPAAAYFLLQAVKLRTSRP